MEVVDHLLQILLGLILSGHIVKLDALGGLDVDLGVGLAHIEHHGVSAAHFLHETAGQHLPQSNEDDQRQHPTKNTHQQRGLLDLRAAGGDAGLQQPGDQIVVRHHGGLIDGLFFGVGEQDTVLLLLNVHLADLLLLHHADEGVVVHLLDLVLGDPRHGQQIEQQQHQHHQQVVVQQGLFR